MRAPAQFRFPALVLLATVALVAGACGGSSSTAGDTGGGASPSPTATPLGGAAAGSPSTEASPGGPVDDPGTSEEPSFEEITPSFGERNLLDVKLLAGDMTWDGKVDASESGWDDTWNVQVDLVLRRSDQHGGLVFAKGSTFSIDWASSRPVEDTDLCKERAGHWTGDIGSPSGETWDKLSVQDPEGIGIVWEDLHSLKLDISLNGIHSGEWCDFPGVQLRCPYEIAPGTAAIWQQTIDDPARLDFSCTDVAPANTFGTWTINTRGLLQEAEDVPPKP